MENKTKSYEANQGPDQSSLKGKMPIPKNSFEALVESSASGERINDPTPLFSLEDLPPLHPM
jgi:hypothetical protein